MPARAVPGCFDQNDCCESTCDGYRCGSKGFNCIDHSVLQQGRAQFYSDCLVYADLDDSGDFSAPEPYTDRDNSGHYTPGEPYEDDDGDGSYTKVPPPRCVPTPAEACAPPP